MTHDDTAGTAPDGVPGTPQPVPVASPAASWQVTAPGEAAVETASGEVAAPRRRRRRWPWVLALVLLLGLAAAAGVAWLIHDARERADAARAVTPGQQELIGATIAAQSETDAQIAAQRTAYRTALAEWEADQAGTAKWQQTNDAPAPSIGNPGGTRIPGGDPDGQAFLDSIGATDVQVIFDAGVDNCGFDAADDDAFSYSVGGCYDSRFRNWLFLAWEPGGEKLVWPVFVHEAMHWYQYQQYYALFLAAQRAGIGHDAYSAAIESDASCRAVIVYGIAPDDYSGSSSPCDVDGWYEGWLRDQLAAIGVRVAAPVAVDYEVREVIRP